MLSNLPHSAKPAIKSTANLASCTIASEMRCKCAQRAQALNIAVLPAFCATRMMGRGCELPPLSFAFTGMLSSVPYNFQPGFPPHTSWRKMTCGLAVKRPHDYEVYLSPDTVEIKRPRPTHCTPFRPQLGNLGATLPQSSNGTFPPPPDSDDTPFYTPASCRLSNNQLEDYLRTEIRHLKRRKLIPKRIASASNDSNPAASTQTYRRGGSSPSSSHSGSDSEGEHLASQNPTSLKAQIYDKPQFSLNQVKLICARLLKEQETRIRHEYETVLNRKLDEKHEEYVQFAKEQLERHSPNDLSYLS